MSFDEFCQQLRVNPEERAKLIFWLAFYRAMKTYESLKP